MAVRPLRVLCPDRDDLGQPCHVHGSRLQPGAFSSLDRGIFVVVGTDNACLNQRTCPTAIAFDAIGDLSITRDFIAFRAQNKFDGTPHSGSSVAHLFVDTHNYKLTKSATFLVRVLSKDTTASPNTVTVQWKLKEHDTFSQPITVTAASTAFYTKTELTDANRLLANFGTASHDTGVEVYFDSASDVNENNLYSFNVFYREGRAYLKGDSNSAHQEIECAGRGSCDRTSGRCQCFDGFSGEACQRNSCPNDCSGHGVCQTLERFVADTGIVTYTGPALGGAYDSEKSMTCLCDSGYRGSDCSKLECPSGADPLGGPSGYGLNGDEELTDARDCSGRGICDSATGQCKCFQGFFGERCESQTTLV